MRAGLAVLLTFRTNHQATRPQISVQAFLMLQCSGITVGRIVEVQDDTKAWARRELYLFRKLTTGSSSVPSGTEKSGTIVYG